MSLLRQGRLGGHGRDLLSRPLARCLERQLSFIRSFLGDPLGRAFGPCLLGGVIGWRCYFTIGWRLIAGRSLVRNDGLAGHSRRKFSTLDLGCICSRGRRPGCSAGGPSTAWRLRCGLFGCFLGMRVGLVGIEHRTPLWRIVRLLVRCTSARPGCGSLRNRCGESTLPRSSGGSPAFALGRKAPRDCLPLAANRLGLEALLVAVEDQLHLVTRPVTSRNVIEASTHLASKPPPVSHRSPKDSAASRAEAHVSDQAL
jgi:hypothetical protein